MTPTFTVLIGSIGRPSLRRSLESIRQQARVDGDQVIVAFDAFEQSAAAIDERLALVRSFGPGFDACAYDSGYHWLGVEQINHALRTIPIIGSHVFTIGDDDIFIDGAYQTIRDICAADPLRPVLYRFVAPNRAVLWDMPRLRSCLISGCCIAAPRPFVPLMHTRLETTHDYDWMVEILARARAAGKAPVWLDYIGVVARPESDHDFTRYCRPAVVVDEVADAA
jgi:hypothetical protein